LQGLVKFKQNPDGKVVGVIDVEAVVVAAVVVSGTLVLVNDAAVETGQA
jgi:hypothetical protein